MNAWTDTSQQTSVTTPTLQMRALGDKGLPQAAEHVRAGLGLEPECTQPTKPSCQALLHPLCVSLPSSSAALIWLPSCSSFHFVPYALVPVALA